MPSGVYKRSKCNGALGALENKEFYMKALSYLKSYEGEV